MLAYPDEELTNYLPPDANFDSDAENTEENYNVDVNRGIDSEETAMTILVAKMERIYKSTNTFTHQRAHNIIAKMERIYKSTNTFTHQRAHNIIRGTSVMGPQQITKNLSPVYTIFLP
ncbi:hypothetical protein QE152_g33553 [Popillia japonica]|uniref:Uncharacterized protein n=1 Tax=Popillia japonica TaxID=7064 RepID=A0AAW1IWR9_POPJA